MAFFTASGSDNNYALQTDLGIIRFGDLSGSGNRMVIADANGDLSTQALPVTSDDQNLTGASLSGTTLQIDIEDGSSASVNLSSLQDGTGTDNQTASEVSYSNLSSGLTATSVQGAIDEINTNTSSTFWSRDATNGETYPSNISDQIGIGTTDPSAQLDIHGTGALIQMQNTTSNHQWEWYTSGSVGNDGIGLYDRTNSSYRIAINDDGNLGVGTTAPTTKFHVYDNTNITPSTSADGAFRIQGSSTSLTIGQNTNYNWIQTWSSKPLAINPIGNNVGVGTASPSEKLNVNGNIKVDNGHLNVGGTSTSTTRYGAVEFYRVDNWVIEDEWQTVRLYDTKTGTQAEIKISGWCNSN